MSDIGECLRELAGQYDDYLARKADEIATLRTRLRELEEGLREIDALDPEGMATGCTRDALQGLVNAMGARARALLNKE